ncbi:flavin reductase [Agrobacterium vitis]|nr:flavin reductase [Agrobacterium vitis]
MIDEHFKSGMRRLASGVSLITTKDTHDAWHGMIATSVTSVSVEPPSLLVCINRSASCHDPLIESGVFCVSFLGEDNDAIAEVFSSSRFKEQRFRDGDWRRISTGAPALARSLASFDCRVKQQLQADSHTIFIGSVEAIELWDAPLSPLVYMNGGYVRCISAGV